MSLERSWDKYFLPHYSFTLLKSSRQQGLNRVTQYSLVIQITYFTSAKKKIHSAESSTALVLKVVLDSSPGAKLAVNMLFKTHF